MLLEQEMNVLMANHCENVLRVTGFNKDIVCFDEKFRGGKAGKDENYHFENLYPIPESSIYDKCEWCKENWSVKGNFYEDSFSKDTLRNDEMETYYYFDTPNVAPELLFQHVSEEFPELEFMLVSSEPGNDIHSIKVYCGGAIHSEEEFDEEEKVYWFGEDEF